MTATPVTPNRLSMIETIYRFGTGQLRGRRALRPQRRAEAHVPDGYLRLNPSDLTGPEPLHLTDAVLRAIESSVGSMPAEHGGMFGGRRARGTVTHFHFDNAADRTTATYTPDTSKLNTLLRDEWNPNNVDFLGFVHSHPRGFWRPSHGDHVYAERILGAIPAMDRMLMPIAQTRPDTNDFVLHPFVVERAHTGVDLRSVSLVVVPESAGTPALNDPAFDRVHHSYDLEATEVTRLVIVGVGGAASFAESMARAGVGEFVLIDPDNVDLPNIGTQQVYRRDVGRPKVDAVADRILDINPHALVVGVHAYLDDLTDDMMRRLVHRPLPHTRAVGPSTTILCGFTDSFWAQARVNRLALHFGVSTIAAQVYQHGHGVELSFHVPGRSAACGRCVLGSRYRAYLSSGYSNAVTSHGTPLWATERLNELKAQVVLAMIHATTPEADPQHPATLRYTEMLNRVARKNLVQARLDPDADLPAFAKAFADADHSRIVTDDTLWLPQEPESLATGFDACGDCGGTGDLAACAGTFSDTRLQPSTQ